MRLRAEETDGGPGGSDDRTLLWELRDSIDAALGPVIPAGSRCALVDFPNSANVGDAAIWAGTRAWLERAGVEIAYSCDRYTYSRSRLAKKLGEGVILFLGGGNLGDLWPGFQVFREQVVSDFPDKPIVQLPQSIWFERSDNAGRAAEIFNRHPALHLFLRDKPSLERARELFETSSSLCTDMVFALEPIQVRDEPVRDIVWLSRTDLEASDALWEPDPDTFTIDWTSDTPPHLHRPLRTYSGYVMNRLLSVATRRWATGMPLPQRSAAALYDWRAEQRLARGCRILGMGKVVVTDRLHGHLICCLLGIPHVILADKYGKLRSFYDTWTDGFATAEFADSAEQASQKARHLLETRAGT